MKAVCIGPVRSTVPTRVDSSTDTRARRSLLGRGQMRCISREKLRWMFAMILVLATCQSTLLVGGKIQGPSRENKLPGVDPSPCPCPVDGATGSDTNHPSRNQSTSKTAIARTHQSRDGLRIEKGSTLIFCGRFECVQDRASSVEWLGGPLPMRRNTQGCLLPGWSSNMDS